MVGFFLLWCWSVWVCLVCGGGGVVFVFVFFDICCEFGGGCLVNFGEFVILRLYSFFLSIIFVFVNIVVMLCRVNCLGGWWFFLMVRWIFFCNIMMLLIKLFIVLILIFSLLKIFIYLFINVTTFTAFSFFFLFKRFLMYEKLLWSCCIGNLCKSLFVCLCVIRVFLKFFLLKM